MLAFSLLATAATSATLLWQGEWRPSPNRLPGRRRHADGLGHVRQFPAAQHDTAE